MITGPACRLLVTALGVLSAAGVAAAIPPEEEDEKDPPVDKQAVVQQLSELFNQQVYRSLPPEDASQRLEIKLKTRLDKIDRICDLTPDQLRKLELAGRGDIKHLGDIVASRRREFMSQDVIVPADITQRLAELAPLGAYGGSLDTLFRERSLLHKTAETILSPDQRERYQSEMHESRLSLLLKLQQSVLKTIEKKKSLDENQRRELLELWAELPCAASGPADATVFRYQASRIAEQKYRDILEDRQWEALRNSFRLVHHYGPALIQLGVIDEPLQDNP